MSSTAEAIISKTKTFINSKEETVVWWKNQDSEANGLPELFTATGMPQEPN